MNKLAFFIGFGMIFILTACSNRPASVEPGATQPVKLQSGAAEITTIEILPVDPGEKVQRILIQGKLPSSCTLLTDVTAKRMQQVFTISANYSQNSTENCDTTKGNFDKVLTLDLSNLAPGDYLVEGSDLTATFTISESMAVADTPAEQPTALPPSAEPTTVPSPVPTPGPAVPVTSSCNNKAAFYADVTIPDGTVFSQGETFTKIWRIRNEGTCMITSEYSLVFAAGDPLDGPLTSPMPEIAPGQTADISINLAAPKQGGKYGANYEFRDPAGNRFGVNSNGIDYIWVEIVVDWGNVQTNTSSVGSNTATSGASGVAVSAPADCSFTENPGYLDTILNLVNAARSAEGIAPLAANSALMAAAKVHSIDMGCNNFLDHTGSDGSKARTRIIGQGYNPSYAAENIYAGATEFGADAQGAFDWWMNSPVHRKNIMNPRPTEVGIGFVNVPSSSFGGYYTMVFAAP